MGQRLARLFIYVLLILEAANTGLWIAHLLPTLAVRDRTTAALVALRGVVSALQLVGGVLLRTGRPSAPPIASAALLASALLTPFEVGLRLVPTNLDPTYRWWMVVGYWVYAGLAVTWLTSASEGPPSR